MRARAGRARRPPGLDGGRAAASGGASGGAVTAGQLLLRSLPAGTLWARARPHPRHEKGHEKGAPQTPHSIVTRTARAAPRLVRRAGRPMPRGAILLLCH